MARTPFRFTAPLLAVLVAPAAHAQQEVCSEVFSQADFQQAMDQVDQAVDEVDLQGAKSTLSYARQELRCIDEIIDPALLARFGRQMAMIFFFDQDEEATRRWGLLSRYSDPDLPWGDLFPEDHPFREGLDMAEDPILGGPDDRSLAPPKKGGIFMNGHLITRPEAPAEVPVFMQVADKKGEVIASYWQDGARFPDQVLGPPGPEPDAPKWWDGPTPAATTAVASVEPEPEPVGPGPEPEPEPRIKEPKPPRDGLPMGQVAVAGGLAVASGTMLALAAASAGGLSDATTEDDLAKVRTRTNLMSMTGLALGAGALGVGVTVLISDEGTSLGISGRF